jgi:LuxR family maltose regulon positive regulatory protein
VESHTIIRTKLCPPVETAALVPRSRLLDALNARALRRLTLVAAPAGFGKTTLLGQWFRHLNSRMCCCWLSLDHEDASPQRFARHFIAALQTVRPEIGRDALQRLDNASLGDITEMLPEVVNQIAELEAPLAVFLDDFQFAGSEPVLHFMELLLNLSAGQFHLVLSSRIRMGLPLAGLRVQNQLTEVTAAHLRFDQEESSDFLTRIQGLDLTEKQLSSLLDHAEGWAAGLQLASLSLRNASRRDEFIESFSGTFRDIADYLVVQVLESQPEVVREFLLRTSVLQRLNADVCRNLTGVVDCQLMLETLEGRNLFIVPLDEERRWYRYHQLFQEFLFGQLRRRFPGEIVSLYARAAEWFSVAGLPAEAVDYALLSGDIVNAVRLVESQAQAEMMAGRMPRVDDWVNRIPEDLRRSHPKLLIAQCTALFHMSRADQAEKTLFALEECVAALPPDRWLQDQIRILRAGIAISRDDVDYILPHLAEPFGELSDFDKGIVNNIRGHAMAALGHYDDAQASLAEARRIHRRTGAAFGVAWSDCFQGMVDLAKGNLHSCYARFLEGGDGTSDTGDRYVTPISSIMRGIVLYEWNRLDESLELLRRNLPLMEQVGHIKVLTLSYITLAKILGARGDLAGAARYFDYCRTLATGQDVPGRRLRALVESERVRFLIATGRVNEAVDIAAAMDITPDSDAQAVPERWERVACLGMLIRARLQIATGVAARSLPLLRHLRKLAGDMRRHRRVIECLILESSALWQLNDRRCAQETLVEAIRLAAPNHALRMFIDEDASGAQVLEGALAALRDTPVVETFAEDLRRAFGTQCSAHGIREAAAGKARSGELWEALSQRELEILRLIAAGQSNSVIARKLHVTENTIKWHIKNIFLKLGVNNRTAAVVSAQQQHLLT